MNEIEDFSKDNQMQTIFTTFLLGVAIGAGGQYMAAKYTDKRRHNEFVAELRSNFLDISNK